MLFPYDRYQALTEPYLVRFPQGEDAFALWLAQSVEKATHRLCQLLGLSLPALEILLVQPDDWSLAPRDEDEDLGFLPYWTDTTSPPTLVVPMEFDAVFGELTQEKLLFLLYQIVSLICLETDPRPWPNEYPLWSDEWQLKFAALWLVQTLDGQQGIVNKDLFAQLAEAFEPEPDGKTPVTVRGFDWYEDTPREEYLAYELLLEQFAADLLARYDPGALARFLTLYRVERDVLLSEDITAMLASALGAGAAEWLEELVYF